MKELLSKAAHSQLSSAIYNDSLKPLSVLHSALKREWQPIFSTFCGQKKSKHFFYKRFLMQLLSAVAKIFFLSF